MVVDAIKTYTPLPRQEIFHISKARLKAYIGGFGSGKTKGGCREIIDLAMQYPGGEAIIGRLKREELEDTTQKAFFEECDPSLIRGYTKGHRRVHFHNGSTVIFRIMSDSRKFKSIEISAFYMDESSEIGEDVFDMLCGRLRHKAVPPHAYHGLITSNPPFEGHWIHNKFVENPMTTEKFIDSLPVNTVRQRLDKEKILEDVKLGANYDSSFIHAPSDENPHLPPGYVGSLMALYPPEWVRMFIDGEFGFLPDGKPVFPSFSHRLHVKHLADVPGEPIYVCWDWGYHHPYAAFLQIIKGKVYVLGEVCGCDETIFKFAPRVQGYMISRFGSRTGNRYIHWGDPAGNQVSDKSEKSTIRLMQSDYNIHVQTKVQHINDGILILRILLNPVPDETTKVPTVKLFIDPSCKKMIGAFQGGYCYDKKRDHTPDHSKTPKKDNIFDHAIDALRAVVGNYPEFRLFLKQPVLKREPTGTFKTWKAIANGKNLSIRV